MGTHVATLLVTRAEVLRFADEPRTLLMSTEEASPTKGNTPALTITKRPTGLAGSVKVKSDRLHGGRVVEAHIRFPAELRGSQPGS